MQSEPLGRVLDGGRSTKIYASRQNKKRNTCRIGNTKEKWSHEENRFLWECYEKSCYPSRKGYMARMKALWIDKEGMRSVSAQRLTTQVKNIENKSILSKMERQQIHSRVTGEVMEDPEEETTETSDTESVRSRQTTEEDTPSEGETFQFDESDEEDRTFLGFDDDNEAVFNTKEDNILQRLKDVIKECKDKKLQPPSLKDIQWSKVKKEIDLVQKVAERVKINNLTELGYLMRAIGIVIGERVGKKCKTEGTSLKASEKEPWWKRRLSASIKEWRKDLSRLEEVKRGKFTLNDRDRDRMNRKYSLDAKGHLYVIHLLKNKIRQGAVKIRYHDEGKLEYHQNNLFRSNQSKLYGELNGLEHTLAETPDPEEATTFWKTIWSEPSSHNKGAEWLKEVKEKMSDLRKQENIKISIEDVKLVIRKMSNWKAPGPDGVHGFWFKKLSNLHIKLTEFLQEALDTGIVPDWMTLGRTVLIMKDRSKGRIASNFRPITCLPLMWKLLTGIIANKLYNHLIHNQLLPNEQKGCRRNSRGTKDQLIIDKAIQRNCRRTCKGLAVGWIDYKKAYDMVPHSWLKEVVQLMGVADNIKKLLFNSMEKWRTILTSNNETLGEVEIKRGIFQGDTLSPLLFIMVLIPLSMILKDTTYGYQFSKGGMKINHLLFMDDLKLYGKTERELNALVDTVHIFSEDIGMKFGMDKCNIMILEKGRRKSTEGIKLPDGELMKQIEVTGYKYLGIVQDDQIRHKEMKEKLEAEYTRRVKKLAKSKLYAGNIISGINAWAVGVIRYSAGIIDWTLEDLKRMDIRTRKLLTMNGTLHPRANVDRLYLKRNEGGRGLISVEECVKMEEKGLSEYVKASEEPMLKEVVKENILRENETKDEYQSRTYEQRMSGYMNKSLHGKFQHAIKEVADKRTWEWLKMGYMKKGTEAMITAAQDQALRTNWIKAKIDGQDCSPKCRLCNEEDESSMHIASGCSVLAQRQYKLRHDLVGRRVHWEICRKHAIACTDKWYEHVPENTTTSADGNVEILWDVEIKTGKKVKHNRPDIVVKNVKENKWELVDVTVPMDHRVKAKEDEKIEKYLDLATEVRQDHHVKVEIIPIVIGALGTIPKRLEKYLKVLGIPDIVGSVQMSVLICTGKILRNVLSL